MNYSFLHEVLNSVEEYEEQNNGKTNINDFRIWLNKKMYKAESASHLIDKHEIDADGLFNDICKQVIMLGRYTKLTLKKGLATFPELVNEDFTYLYRLMDYDSLTKTQLIEKNVHEKQTGIEIIKRLIKYGLIEEFPDENDKRSKRIAVTKKGKEVFRKSMQNINQVSKILSADLTDKEKATLLNLLTKVNRFHNMAYHNFRDEPLETLENYLP